MDTRTLTRPPRLAEALLRRCLPVGAAGLTILGDLREDYQARHAAGTRARLWYWREALLLAARYLTTRPAAPGRAPRAWTVANDAKIAFRSIRRNPVSSTIIILTLGAAMGASTVGFSFADFAILRGLPVDDGQRVVAVYGVDTRQTDGRARVSPANFRDLKTRLTSLEYLSAYQVGSVTIIDRGIPVSLDAARISADFFNAWAQTPFAGRGLQRGDDVAGAAGVVVLAHQYWQRVHAGSLAAIGQALMIDGRPHTVVGIAAPALEMGNLAAIDVWVPIEVGADASRVDRQFALTGRLKANVSLAQARAEIDTVARALAVEFPVENRDWEAVILPIAEVAYGNGFWIIITLFLSAVVLVMLIACANAASLVLAKTLALRREIALRAALGAGRWRLIRQALLEGLVLSTLSAVVAVPSAELCLRAIRTIDSPEFQQLRLDWHELVFVAVIAVITPVVFALLPTLSAIRFDLRTALQSGGVRAGGVSTRGRSVLVVAQLTLAVTMLVAAGLALRTAINLSHVDMGIRTRGGLTFGVDLQNAAAGIGDARSLIAEARRRLQTIPGVASVSVFEAMPVLSGERVVTMTIDGRVTNPGEAVPWALVNGSDAESLSAMGVTVVRGRMPTDSEEERGEAVAVIGRTAADLHFGSAAAAIDQSVTIEDRGERQRFVIVGVVSDVVGNSIERGPQPRLWTGLRNLRRPTVIVVPIGEAADLPAAIRREMAAVAPSLPLDGLETLDAAFARFVASDRGIIAIFVGYAALALILAGAGLYGLISYTVGLRLPEFGTRFALGATPSDVLRLVFAQVVKLIAVGLIGGIAAGLAVGQGMRQILFGVSATDPVTILAVVGVIALVALIATVRPALRAARLNLVDALRAE